MNICEHCKTENALMVVGANPPYSEEHLQCRKCDGTYVLHGWLDKFMEIVRNIHKGDKYGSHDYFDYHLMGVALRAQEKAIEAKLDPLTAFAIGLGHDAIEDHGVGVAQTLSDVSPHPIVTEIIFLSHMDTKFVLADGSTDQVSYYEYIKRINTPYALLVKEADLEFNLSQPDAKKFKKYSTYKFALDTIRLKRMLRA